MLLRECRNAPLSQYPLHKLTFLWTYTLKTIRYYKNTRNIYSTSIKPPSTTEKCVSHDLNRYPAQTFVANCFIFITVVLGDTLIFQAQASQVCLHVLSYVGHGSLKHLSWKEQDFFSSSWRGFTSHLWCFFGSKNWWSPRYFIHSGLSAADVRIHFVSSKECLWIFIFWTMTTIWEEAIYFYCEPSSPNWSIRHQIFPTYKSQSWHPFAGISTPTQTLNQMTLTFMAVWHGNVSDSTSLLLWA